MKLGQNVVELEVKIDEMVLKPLNMILEIDIPNIYKVKKSLTKITGELELAKTKYYQMNRHSSAGSLSNNKVEFIKDEMDDLQQKFEQCRVSAC